MNSSLRKIIFFVMVVGMTYLGYQYMIKPAQKRLAEQNIRIHNKADKLAKIDQATATAENLNTQLGQLQNAIDFFESKLPPKSQIHQVLANVTLIVEKQGLEPKTISTLPTKENNGYIEQPLKMELDGDFKSFYSFLLELEKLPRIMKISQLELKKIEGLEGRVAANFIVSIFFQNES
jgi:type IV pilus assembly protein PilO